MGFRDSEQGATSDDRQPTNDERRATSDDRQSPSNDHQFNATRADRQSPIAEWKRSAEAAVAHKYIHTRSMTRRTRKRGQYIKIQALREREANTSHEKAERPGRPRRGNPARKPYPPTKCKPKRDTHTRRKRNRNTTQAANTEASSQHKRSHQRGGDQPSNWEYTSYLYTLQAPFHITI